MTTSNIMIIDNKTIQNVGEPDENTTVWQFIERNGKEDNGNFDIVTGYFSVAGLSQLYEKLSDNIKYNIVLAEMMTDEDFAKNAVNLLQEDCSIENALQINDLAKNAADFLRRQTVELKAVANAFCHAKAYVYKHSTDSAHNFYVAGSSNLTAAGLGIKETANVELNTAETGSTNLTFREIKKWFDTLWDKTAKSKIKINPDDKVETDVKQYFIDKIETVFRTYTPEEIYYKILFELFNPEVDIDDLNDTDIKRLEDSVIYNTLFEYQKKGVISLIKKLEKFSGAILADAVGLGKTFSALAVIKYYQLKGYNVVLLCPKKLENNWLQYLKRRGSRFDKDEFDYIVRFHTDLDGRLQTRLETAYDDAPLHWLQKRQKLLLVIDESHNLRNDKSNRYINLLNQLVKNAGGVNNRDFKILQLSATPINNSFDDIKSQFNLIAKGEDNAFKRDEFEIPSLLNLFTVINKRFNKWAADPQRTIKDFVENTPPNFFKLTDNLIVSRTRHLIEHTLGENLGFPQKSKPRNIYNTLDRLGSFRNADQIYDALIKANLAAYMPSRYMKLADEANLSWDDDRYREMFLVKMMMSLFFKRLESSWYSCKITMQNVLRVHQATLDKVNDFLKTQNGEITIDGDLDEIAEDGEFYVGKKMLRLSEMENIEGFKTDLENDVEIISNFIEQINDFEEDFNEGTLEDPKLEKLFSVIKEKQNQTNKKVVIFTAYADTAEYIYNNIAAKFPNYRTAIVTGVMHKTYDGVSAKNVNEVLQRFAPYSKMYKELEWSPLYEAAALSRDTYFDDTKNNWKVDYDTWKNLIKTSGDTKYIKFAQNLDNEIDILVATDCLSEGQNLQDADLVVNYDIHWNPVRIIQRLGRIDRIGSPNKVISSINFWPNDNIDKYLNLEKRIINRMSAMTITGAETVEINKEFEKITRDNPIISQSEKKLIEQMEQNNISDIEITENQTLDLSDFSLELYRQDLTEYLAEHKEKFMNMPSGAFSGFELAQDENPELNSSLVAVVAYPHKNCKTDKYSKVYLMMQPADGNTEPDFVEMNYAQILEFLHQYRKKETALPQWILKGDKDKIMKLSQILKNWMRNIAPRQAKNNIMSILGGGKSLAAAPKSIDDEADFSKYDLLAWEYVAKR